MYVIDIVFHRGPRITHEIRKKVTFCGNRAVWEHFTYVEERNEKPQVHGVGKADPVAFTAIVRGNQRWLRSYFRSRLADWAAADDLAQDVFITAFRQIQSFRGDSSVASWLRGIAHNHLRNHLRKHREEALGGSEELQALLEQSCDQSHEQLDDSRTIEALATCKARLPQFARGLLDLRYGEGKSVHEISQITGKGYSALTMQFHRLRDLLAECITSELEGGKA